MTIGQTAPTDPLDQFRQLLADKERRIADLERAAGRKSLLGFHAYRSTNESAIATSGTRDITFDTIMQAKGGWQTVGAITPTSTFTVPTGGDGLYQVDFGMYWAANVAAIFVAATVNNLAVAASPNGNGPGTVDRTYSGAAAYLVAGDVLRLHVLNLSGGNITPTFFTGDINTLRVPYLSAWRVAT